MAYNKGKEKDLKESKNSKGKNEHVWGGSEGRSYKDGMFRSLFHNKKNLIELFNALEGTDYDETTDLEIRTLEGIFADAFRNNTGFEIDHLFLMLVEQEMKLSDSFPEGMEEKQGRSSSLDVTVRVININYEAGHEILSRSPILLGYSYFVYLVREHKNSGESLRKALRSAMTICQEAGILVEFIEEHGGEIMGYWEQKSDRIICRRSETGNDRRSINGPSDLLSIYLYESVRLSKVKLTGVLQNKFCALPFHSLQNKMSKAHEADSN